MPPLKGDTAHMKHWHCSQGLRAYNWDTDLVTFSYRKSIDYVTANQPKFKINRYKQKVKQLYLPE